jgi:hypothetical protein
MNEPADEELPLPQLVFDADGITWRWPHLAVLKAEIVPVASHHEVHLLVEIRDRDTGKLRTQLFITDFDERIVSGTDQALLIERVLRQSYLKVCAHELDELLRIGSNWKDPHLVEEPHSEKAP